VVREERLKRFKSCDECLSIHNEGHKVCEIGYRIEHRKRRGRINIVDGSIISIPKEKCPKPTTYAHLISIQLTEKDRIEAAKNATL
jgi:hypothetical protein